MINSILIFMSSIALLFASTMMFQKPKVPEPRFVSFHEDRMWEEATEADIIEYLDTLVVFK